MLREDLRSIYRKGRSIRNLRERIEVIESRVMSITQRLSQMPKGSAHDSNMLERYIDLKIKLEKRIEDLEHDLIVAELYLADIKDPELYMILTHKYKEMMTWEETADAMGPGYTAEAIKKKVYRYFDKENKA